jgi:DHA1 family multidrug resistance protein-like MFS transporter
VSIRSDKLPLASDITSAASAIAGNTFLRSLCGAAFPLFATYMFEGLGVQWAGTLLGCVSACLVPIPIIFYYYGARIRKRSKFAPTRGSNGQGEDDKSDSTDQLPAEKASNVASGEGNV